MNAGQLAIRIASETERRDAFRLRYECFTVENDDRRYADDLNRLYVAPRDNGNGQLMVAMNEDQQVVGTVRYWTGAVWDFPTELTYDFAEYRQFVDVPDEVLQRAALLGRAAVAKDYRQVGVYKQMLSCCEALSRQAGILLHLGYVAERSTTVSPALLRYGWTKAPPSIRCGEWMGHCYYKIL